MRAAERAATPASPAAGLSYSCHFVTALLPLSWASVMRKRRKERERDNEEENGVEVQERDR